VTQLTSAGPGGVPGDINLDPGLGDGTDAGATPRGGGGAGSPSAAPTSPGGPGSGIGPADPARGGSSTPAPSGGGVSGNSGSGSFTPVAHSGGAKTQGSASTGAPAPTGRSTTAAAQVAGTGTGGGTSTSGVNVSQKFGSLPLPFEPNLGQVPASTGVQFYSHGPGFGFYLTADGAATLDLTRPGQSTAPGATVTRDALRLSLDGANPAPRLLAQNEQAGRSNYFTGAQALTNVPQYGQVLEQGVYQGIDAVWGGTSQRQLEQTFVLAPGADPSAIRLHIAGATSLALDGQGNLMIGTGGGTLLMTAPTLSQAGTGDTKQAVTGSMMIRSDGDVGFQVGAYDNTRALTIDPVLVYSSYLGGSGNDQANAIAADGAGDVYAAGSTASTNFPTTTGSYQTSSPGQAAFVTKLNAAGTAYVYSTYLSGSDTDHTDTVTPLGIAVDAAGNAYVTGNTSATDFPTSNAYQGTAGAGGAAFVTKLSATGDDLIYSTFLGNSSASGKAIAVNSAGSAYVTGVTGSGFPTASGALQPAFGGGGSDGFVTKLSQSGSSLEYSTYLGGSGNDWGNGIAVDAAGDAYVTGQAGWIGNGQPGNFPTTTGAFITSRLTQGTTGFVSELNAAGATLTYSTLLGGSATGDVGNAIALDAFGNAYVTGAAVSPNFPTTSGAFQTSFSGSSAAYATKVNAAGSGLVYSTFLSGAAAASGAGIAVDTAGYATVAGQTNGTFPTTAGAVQTAYGGGTSDAFLTRVASDGTALAYSTYLGGSAADSAAGAAVDDFGNAYAAGMTASNNFPTKNPIQGSSGGGNDAWVAKLGLLPAAPVFTAITPDTGWSSSDQDTNAQNLTIKGTSAASATVTVSRSDLGVIGSTTADASGNWSFDYTGTTLPEGVYSFTATATVSGLTSAPSPAFPVIVDLTC
jgi:hypothetical protein